MSIGRTIADLELRNAATMRAAQSEYDSRSDDDSDDLLTDDDALIQARDDILSSGAWVADTLAKLTDTTEGWKSYEVFGRDGSPLPCELTGAQLLAVVLLGFDKDALAARYELRDRLAAVLRADIRSRADELLRGHERAQERMRDEWLIDRSEA